MRRNWMAWLECLIRGHDDSMRRSSGRLYLCCERCGRETPGWTVTSKPSRSVDVRPPARICHWHRKVATGNRDTCRKDAA
jgi:hypothetical protein